MKLFSIALLLSLHSYTAAQTNKLASKKIDSTFSSYNDKTPGVAVAVVQAGKVVFKKGYGMANLGYNIPITSQTLFNLASVSKQFTAFAIYLLEDEGKISFEDDVRKYIPELPQYEKPIRIKNLLGHTSGLMDHGALASIAGEYGKITTTENNLKIISKSNSLNFVPGTSFGYCNSNYTLLAEIVHRISGKTFAEFAKEKIFTPLGMSSTLVADNYEIIIKNKAESYELADKKYLQKVLIESNSGPSNVWSTVEDLSKWILNFDNPVVGNAKLVQAFNEPSYLDNGTKAILRITDNDTIFHAKGQNVSKEKGKYLGHGGHAAGFRTFMGRYPNHRLAIIQLSNDEHNEQLGGRWDIADYFIKTPTSVSPPVSSSPRPAPATIITDYKTDLNEFRGMFYHSWLDTHYWFEVANGKLIMKHKSLYDIALQRKSENTFTGYGDNTFSFELTFIKNEKGETSGFTISNWGAKNLKFEKEN